LLAHLDAVVGGEEDTECWPDNWLTFRVFAAMGTQWNVGMSGAIGLRYEALPVVLNMMGIAKKERAEIFDSLRIMESEVLTMFRDS